jgi:flagellar assembly factor FliW
MTKQMKTTKAGQPIPERVITFGQGLPGFEEHRRFVLMASPALDPFALLQGAGADSPSFVGIDPRLVDPAYQTPLGHDDLARLEARDDDSLLWLVLVAAQPDGSATVNLRAPVVINPASMRGIQVVPHESPYRLDQPLSIE